MIEGGNYCHPLPSASDSDVEAALASLGVKWTESIQEPPRTILAVSDCQYYRVAFIALYALKIFHEEPFTLVFREEGFEVRARDQRMIHRSLDAAGVLDAHRDYQEFH